MEEGMSVYKVLVGMPEGKRPLGRPRRRWEDNIKMDLREIGMGVDNRFLLAQKSPIASICEYDNEPWDFIKKAGYS
jgi:hypothetical protein